MKILILIVARSNSTRLKNKNLLKINKKSLVDYSIDFSKTISGDKLILLSTDSPVIQRKAVSKNIFSPWLRPSKLSNGKSNLGDVAIHAVKWYEKNIQSIDAVLLLQSSSPFRNKKSIREGIKIFKKNVDNTVVSVSPAAKHPYIQFKIENNYLHPFIKNIDLNNQSGTFPKSYNLNGNFYIISKKKLFKDKCLIKGKKITPVILNSYYESLDIDTINELNYARSINVK